MEVGVVDLHGNRGEIPHLPGHLGHFADLDLQASSFGDQFGVTANLLADTGGQRLDPFRIDDFRQRKVGHFAAQVRLIVHEPPDPKALRANRHNVHAAIRQMRAFDDASDRAHRVWLSFLVGHFTPLADQDYAKR